MFNSRTWLTYPYRDFISLFLLLWLITSQRKFLIEMNVIDSTNNVENIKNRLNLGQKSNFKQCLYVGFPLFILWGVHQRDTRINLISVNCLDTKFLGISLNI